MYSLGNSAPVVNPGYYDVPIQNQYSNPVRQGNEIKLSNYALNTTIGNTINSNDDNYIVYSPPTKASPSLYIEQDAPMSGYEYGNNVSKYIPAMNETDKFNQRQVPTGFIPPQVIEKFTGEGGGGGGRGSGGGVARSGGGLNMARTGGAGSMRSNTMNMSNSGRGYGVQVDGGRRDGQASVGFQQLARNQELAHHPNRHHQPERRRRRQVYNNYIPLERPAWGYYNDYLNVAAIPNIAGYYDNVVDYVVEDDYDNMDYNNDYQYEQQENKKTNKKNELENIKSTDIDDLKLMAENIKKDKLKKKKKNKNKPSAIYLVILLLIVLILLMLYMILKNPKKVRF
jgi:hypothetical protein